MMIQKVRKKQILIDVGKYGVTISGDRVTKRGVIENYDNNAGE